MSARGRERVTFELPFVRGKQRPRHRGGVTYTPRRTREDEAAVAEAFREAAGDPAPFAGRGVPVSVTVDMFRAMPTSRPSSVRTEPDVAGGHAPDVDNVVKLVLDGLNGVAYEDDHQVTFVMATKHDRSRAWGDHMIVSVSWDRAAND